ncbi:MAG: DUF808 domain-containing protein [Epsilonproteobacteria bacterium]|nr:DUF808 domain-containing protein [Campylobacterota bacterium]NPA64377.1 DUF808 domain-containing protein [Campylobacterota bacterium]
MASGFLALFDDIAALMDDVAVMTKVAGKKTAGILGDDLAVNAQKAMGFASSRELPVLWEITKGSFINKLIVLPIVFLLSYFYPPLVTWLLMAGGLYLAYEGAEKVIEYLFHHKSHHESEPKPLSKEEILAKEAKKIKSAIRTDLILSLEIVIIAMSAIKADSFLEQAIAVTIVAFLATIGVYGIVALIVRMDDIGFYLIGTGTKIGEVVGKFLVAALPKVVKALGYIGTFAMLLVAGSIYTHHIEALHHLAQKVPGWVADLVVGLVIGLAMVGIVKVIERVKN